MRQYPNLFNFDPAAGEILVLYGECFGGRIGSGWKAYTRDAQATSFMLFDVAVIPVSVIDSLENPEQAAHYRDRKQIFLDRSAFLRLCSEISMTSAPFLGTIKGDLLPLSHEGVWDLLQQNAPSTYVNLDGEYHRAEGIVLRNENRSFIAKIRFEDYERTFRKAGRLDLF
jgi:hypothetical protein